LALKNVHFAVFGAIKLRCTIAFFQRLAAFLFASVSYILKIIFKRLKHAQISLKSK